MKIPCQIIQFLFFVVITSSCNNDKNIIELLDSKNTDDIIMGANKAGSSRKIKFIPYILANAADWRMSTSLNFKGTTVYQAKMEALKKIFKQSPSTQITYKPDSAIIKFYTLLYEKSRE